MPVTPPPFVRGTTERLQDVCIGRPVLLSRPEGILPLPSLLGGPKTDLFGLPADPRSPPTLLPLTPMWTKSSSTRPSS